MNDSLSSVKRAFDAWRLGRANRSERIPESLWGMAIALYPEYKRSTICDNLRLNGGAFKARLLQRNEVLPSNQGFVLAVPSAREPSATINREIRLNLHGRERDVSLCFDMHALGEVMSQLREWL